MLGMSVSGIYRAAVGLLCLFVTPDVQAQPPKGPNCTLTLAVYSPLGDPLPFVIEGVSLADPSGVSLLGRRVDGLRTTLEGGVVRFSTPGLIRAKVIEVALRLAGGQRIKEKMELPNCHSRKSLYFGQRVNQPHASGILVSGQLVGCRDYTGWWVSGIPMFGDLVRLRVEAPIERLGGFTLLFPANGVRHVLLIGNGKSVLKTTEADLVVGQNVDMGTIDVSKQCLQ